MGSDYMKTVLLIEDEPNFRRDLSYLLEEEGYRTIEAEDGNTGLELITKEKPDMILCDVKLPNMSGIDLLKKIRMEGSCNKYTPFIFLTGYKDKAQMLDSISFAPDDYLVKPVSFDVLTAKINSAINRVELINGHKIPANDSGNASSIQKYSIVKEINKQLLSIIESASLLRPQIEEKFAATLSKIISSALSINALSEQVREKTKELEVELVNISKLMEAVTALVKKDKNNLMRLIRIDVEHNMPGIIVDYKYFSKAVEEIVKEMVALTPVDSAISVRAKTRGIGVEIYISNDVISKDLCDKILSSNFAKAVLGLQGIELSCVSMAGQYAIAISIPGYRVG